MAKVSGLRGAKKQPMEIGCLGYAVITYRFNQIVGLRKIIMHDFRPGNKIVNRSFIFPQPNHERANDRADPKRQAVDDACNDMAQQHGSDPGRGMVLHFSNFDPANPLTDGISAPKNRHQQ